MKANLLVILFLSLFYNVSFSQQNAFYTINVYTDHLVMIDSTGMVTDVGSIGRNVSKISCGLAFKKDSLFLSMEDTLYYVNTITGYATPLFRTYNSTSTQGIWGAISFDIHDELYLFKEEIAYNQGMLYRVNMSNGSSFPVSGNLSGDPSILAMAFNSTTLYGASELNDKLLTFDVNTGVVNYYSNNMLGMSFTNAMTVSNGNVYGLDITNETTSDSTRFCLINKVTGISNLLYTFHDLYTGLAYGLVPGSPNVISEIDKPNINIFPNPGNGNFVFTTNGMAGEQIKLEIIDVVGKIVFQNSLSLQDGHVQFPLSLDLTEGVYTLIVEVGSNRYSRKLSVLK